VDCIRTFFRRRFRYESALYPRFQASVNEEGVPQFKLDVVVAASGFKNKDQQILEEYMLDLAEAEDEELEEDDSEDSSEEDADVDDDPIVPQRDAAETSGIPDMEEHQDRESQSKDAAESDENDGIEDLSNHADALRLDGSSPRGKDILRKLVSSEVSRERARNVSKYHSRRGPGQGGRAKGSKAKQDTRVKVDKSGIWG